MPRKKTKPKSKKTKYERIKRKRKMLYKCVLKTEIIKHITFQEKNEHGAFNNIIKSLPYYHLTFQHSFELNRALDISEDTPTVLNALFQIETSKKEVADNYVVGQEYKELPINV